MSHMDPTQKSQNNRFLLIVWVTLLLFAVISRNPLFNITALLVILAITKLLWRPGEPPVLLFAMTYHWVQATVQTFYVNFQGKELGELADTHHIEDAVWLSLIGVLIIAFGIRVGAGKPAGGNLHSSVDAVASGLSIQRLFRGSLFAIVLANVLEFLSAFSGGLRQPILALTNLHWVVIYLFTYAVLRQRRGYQSLAAVFIIELLIGFLGYFSGFKSILVITLLAALASPDALKGVRLRTAILASAVIMVLALVWTAVKKDYRTFLNKGTGDQVVLVSIGDRVEKLRNLVGDLSPDQFGDSVELLVERISYVKFFGETIYTVPDHIPHENGLLWREALLNSLVPRFIYPDKPVVDDSARTTRYAGGWVAGMEEGTSISLGYVAESYIDFGPVYMMLPLLLWGMFVGWIYRVFVRMSHFAILGYACATVVIFLNASLLESSNAKIVAGLVLGSLVLFVVQRNFGGHLLRWLGLQGVA